MKCVRVDTKRCMIHGMPSIENLLDKPFILNAMVKLLNKLHKTDGVPSSEEYSEEDVEDIDG